MLTQKFFTLLLLEHIQELSKHTTLGAFHSDTIPLKLPKFNRDTSWFILGAYHPHPWASCKLRVWDTWRRHDKTPPHRQDNILATLEFPKNYIKIYIDSKAPRILRFFFYFFAKHHHQQPFDIPNTDLVIGLLLVRLIMMRPTTAPSRITHTNNILSILLLGEWRKINIPRILLSFLSPLYTPLCLGLATNAKRSETQ